MSRNDLEVLEKHIDSVTYTWGAINAVVSNDGTSMRVECSTGGATIILCLANEATMTATCERMSFRFTCTKM